MKPQIALSPEQMRELESLGLDCSDASMCWVVYTDEHSPILEVNQFANLDYVEKYIPAYTLEDIISKLKMKIDWVPRIEKPIKWQSYRFNKYFYGDTPLDAAFVMLKYAIKNHPDKIKRL